MTYEVFWKKQALNELDEIWKSAADKEGIENTATRINIELTHKPLDAGESRIAGVRRRFALEPALLYEEADTSRRLGFHLAEKELPKSIQREVSVR